MSWTQVGANITTPNSEENFGSTIALSADGTVIAVGARLNDGTTGINYDNRGCIRIFKWNGTAWNQLGTDITGDEQNDKVGEYGLSISKDGNVVAIGLCGKNGDIGQVRVYWYNGTSWNQLGSSINGSTYQSGFGGSVSLSLNGYTIIIGSSGYSSSGGPGSNYAGAAYVYDWDGTNWTQRGTGIFGDANSFNGTSVSISNNGNIIAIGAPYNRVNSIEYYTGRVQVYVWNAISSAWEQRGANLDGIQNTSEKFGQSISLSPDGSIITIGAPENSASGSFTGAIRVFVWNGTIWVQRGSDIYGNENNALGELVASSSDGTIVAASRGPWGNVAGIFQWNGSTWNALGTAFTGTSAYEYKGSGIGLSSDGLTFAVGSKGWNSTGRAQVFTYAVSVPCLPAGTRVLTAAGYKAVEELAQDDLIVTSEGQAVPFKVYTTDITITTEKNAAYLIPAHTFGKFPVKDLTLSPNHAFQSRPGVWQIPQYAAIMHPEICQVDVGKPVTYYHIETPDYFKDNLVVEGTVVESFAHKQLRKGEIVYSYSPRYNGFIRSQAARQSQARLIKS